jgi:hypothetical protein
MLKQFLLKTCILIFPLLLFILFTNIKIDSGFVMHDRSDQIADVLISGKNAVVKYIPSEWAALQLAVVRERKKLHDTIPKDILLFGSSLSSEVNSDIFPEHSFYNCALPGASFLDAIALYGLYKENRMLPEYLIINIAFSSFHSRKSVTVDNEIHYVADATTPLNVNFKLLNEYKQGKEYLGIEDDVGENDNSNGTDLKDILELFSPDYFQLNFWSLSEGNIVSTDSLTYKDFFVIRSDGGYSLVEQSKIDSVKVKTKAEKFAQIHKSNFFIPSDTTSVYWSYFEKLMFALKKDGVEPVIFITPVNPIVFQKLSNSDEVDLEKKIKNFCGENEILIIGSFNPQKYGIYYTSNFYIDAYHPVKSVVNTIFYCHKDDLKEIGITVSDSLETNKTMLTYYWENSKLLSINRKH